MTCQEYKERTHGGGSSGNTPGGSSSGACARVGVQPVREVLVCVCVSLVCLVCVW